jgi:methylamine--corrinoid protein Co-methyltransferase
MVAKKRVDIYEAYDRFYEGEKVREDLWDYTIIPSNASAMKEKYDISFGPDIIPSDPDLSDRLFLAGVDMLLTTGLYNYDLGRVMHISEDELYDGIKAAPKRLTLGFGKEKCECEARRGNDLRKPIIQGGPTGAPVSEEIFVPMIQSYVQEPVIDTIVSGVLNTVNGHAVSTNTPWEIRATMAEIRNVREASRMSHRPGMCI